MATPAQLGISYMQSVFNNQNLIPGAADAIAANPPIQYYDDGVQVLLPPVPSGNQASPPPLPTNLQVVYAQSFMGYTIPAGMPRPVNNNGALQIYPLQMPGVTSGSVTNNQLTANNKVLLNILMAALLPLIQSYSPARYGQDASGLAKLSDMVLNNRDTSNFLNPKESNTLVGNVAMGAVNLQKAIVTNPVYKAVAPTIANLVVPGSGAIVSAGLSGEAAVLNKISPAGSGPASLSTTAQAAYGQVNAFQQSQAAPQGTVAAGQAATPAAQSVEVPATTASFTQYVAAATAPAPAFDWTPWLIGGGIVILLIGGIWIIKKA
jgi:hypothetical protein